MNGNGRCCLPHYLHSLVPDCFNATGQFDQNFSIIVSVPDYSAISTPAIFQDDAVFRSAGKGGTLENRLSARPVRTIVTRRCGRGNERISEGGPVVTAWAGGRKAAGSR